LVFACAALAGWAIGAWAAVSFLAAVGVGGVQRRRRSTV
jgi:hypothetical protein